MPRTAKSKPTPATEISIAAAAEQLGTTEQVLRLALIDIRPDDFDTVKSLPVLDFEAVANKIRQQQQPQLPAQSENLENSETLTQHVVEPTTRQPQNAPIVPQAPQQEITNSTPSPTSNTGLSVVEQLAKQASEEIAAVDAIAQVRNTLIINNLNVRDAELVEGLNQRWQGQKQEYLGAIRDLASLASHPVEITPDEIDLPQEIDSIITELGKKLSA